MNASTAAAKSASPGFFVPLTCLAVSFAATGCGGDDTKTVTVGETATVGAPSPQSSPPTQTAPPDETTTAAPATEAPLPGGRPALDGTYMMRVRDTSFVKENIVAGVGSEATRYMTTTCQGEACRVELRRSGDSGGFET